MLAEFIEKLLDVATPKTYEVGGKRYPRSPKAMC